MSYTVLARRYRSGTFDEVIGQEHIAQTLKKAIATGRIAHAYLFCGTRGTGKTSTARILAKCLNCQSFDAPTTEPCNKCASCLAIARGDDIDVIEIDAASNTGVDNVRDIIDNARYRPAHSRFKIYIIDEVHALSKNAFNALLKTLEEPPSHVKFILATTEPEKVLPTILSRCQRYDFRNIPTREIAAHLKAICKKEKIDADDDALLLVARAGAGSMRDSLSLLDRLLSVGEKTLTAEMIEQLLGMPKSQLVFDLAAAIGNGDVKAILTGADRMIQSGLSTDILIASLIDHLRNLLIVRTCGMDSELVEVTGAAQKELASQAQRFDPVILSQDIAVLEELRRQVRSSGAGRAMLDATLVRLALAEQFGPVEEAIAGVGEAPAAAPVKKNGEVSRGETAAKSPSEERGAAEAAKAQVRAASAAAAETDARAQADEPTTEATASAPITSGEDDDDDLPAPGKVWTGPSLAELMKQSPLASAPPVKETPNVEPAQGDVWRRMVALLAEKGPGLPGLLDGGQYVGIRDGLAVIRYPHDHETVVRMLDRNGKKEQIRDAFTKVLGDAVGVKFELDDAPAETAVAPAPTVAAAPPKRATPAASPPPPPMPVEPVIRLTPELRESLRSDPLIRAAMDELGGEIVKVE